MQFKSFAVDLLEATCVGECNCALDALRYFKHDTTIILLSQYILYMDVLHCYKRVKKLTLRLWQSSRKMHRFVCNIEMWVLPLYWYTGNSIDLIDLIYKWLNDKIRCKWFVCYSFILFVDIGWYHDNVKVENSNGLNGTFEFHINESSQS